jgi:Icc-related predicted phosphoesterase
VIRVAAVGDIHVGPDSVGAVRADLDHIDERADLLLLAGDLTTHGTVEQAELAAAEFADVAIPTVAVLGNHDHHGGDPEGVRRALEAAGVVVLERASHVLDVGGVRVGIVGAKGFGGGFVGASLSEFGEAEMKAFARTTIAAAADVERLLFAVQADVRILLLHYAPVRDTLVGEPSEIYPFLGSYLFAEAADRGGADLVIHGHAHRGTEVGTTPGGVPVRNASKPVLRTAYAIYELDPGRARRSPLVEAERG